MNGRAGQLHFALEMTVSHVAKGADIAAPSGMMDHMVRAIRAALDVDGYTDTRILPYSPMQPSMPPHSTDPSGRRRSLAMPGGDRNEDNPASIKAKAVLGIIFSCCKMDMETFAHLHDKLTKKSENFDESI